MLTIIAILLVPLTWYLLWRTSFGLRLRSCGENPQAAETLGVNVYRYKYYGVVVSGALAGLGGAFLSMVASSIYREGQTAGRGYIGLATMIFGNWRPGGLAGGAVLFGYTDALQLRRGSESVHALLLLIAVVLLAVGVWQIVRGTRIAGAVSIGMARSRRVVVLHHRPDPGRVRAGGAVRHDARRAGPRLAAAETAGGRRPALPPRRRLATRDGSACAWRTLAL